MSREPPRGPRTLRQCFLIHEAVEELQLRQGSGEVFNSLRPGVGFQDSVESRCSTPRDVRSIVRAKGLEIGEIAGAGGGVPEESATCGRAVPRSGVGCFPWGFPWGFVQLQERTHENTDTAIGLAWWGGFTCRRENASTEAQPSPSDTAPTRSEASSSGTSEQIPNSSPGPVQPYDWHRGSNHASKHAHANPGRRASGPAWTRRIRSASPPKCLPAKPRWLGCLQGTGRTRGDVVGSG